MIMSELRLLPSRRGYILLPRGIFTLSLLNHGTVTFGFFVAILEQFHSLAVHFSFQIAQNRLTRHTWLRLRNKRKLINKLQSIIQTSQ
jgi:hypothetical protein